MTEQPKPDWWPECPYKIPYRTVSSLDEQAYEAIQAIKREGWEKAEKEILERLKERGIEL